MGTESPISSPAASCRCGVPCCLDLSPARTSERGHWRAELAPLAPPVPFGVPTEWTLLLHDAEGRPVAALEIVADGGMPRRGERYPAAPRVTPLAPGRYRIAGLEFSAPGWWLLRLVIVTALGADTVTFNLALE